MDRDTRYGRVHRSHSPGESLPEYSSLWEDKEIRKDGIQVKKNERGALSLNWRSWKQNTANLVRAIPPFWKHLVWPTIKTIRVSKRQLFGFALLFICGLVPFIVVGRLTMSSSTIFDSAFVEKTISCGDAIGIPQNSTVSGIEGLFVLDSTFGKLPFSSVKIIDVSWDVLVGRGAQLLAWWIGYNVFSDAMLRVIERHPASYNAFFDICLHGPSFGALWTMLRDLGRTKSKRTWLLYFYMVWSILYMVTLPIILSAMTGYVNTSIAWVDMEGTNNIVPAAGFSASLVVYNAGNVSFTDPKCVPSNQWSDIESHGFSIRAYCDCRLPNGTITKFNEWIKRPKDATNRISFFSDCNYRYPGQNKTFLSNSKDGLQYCNKTNTIEIDNKEYEVRGLNYTNGYCYQGRGYDRTVLNDKIRCLPDTQNPLYQWGFSTMLTSVFVIFNLIWSLTMYAVWQDAQFKSNLVKSGYRMTPLRAAFTLAMIAKRETGHNSLDLIRADTKSLNEQLFGFRSRKTRHSGAEVDFGVFKDEGKEGFEVASAEGGLKRRRTDTTSRTTQEP
ncbi:hypothetical protein B0J11DRAFT_442790 [Dendryphion nanum]|uniref:Uncharacterized protein n=1 Tax=Dendryphion nanum TaxID=256645 RepID=A0A9P9DDK7_9PLEO|nr:hypothetical protein B0J11DRAFT_442790 [Dendryphion nanum]